MAMWWNCISRILSPSWTHTLHEVSVTGRFIDADPTRADDAPILAVNSVEILEAADPQHSVEGNERWVNVACRFSDIDDTPAPDGKYFEEIMENNEPGMGSLLAANLR